VLDAMSGIVFRDDSQVCKGTLRKFYTSENPRIEISIEELEPPVKKILDPLNQLKG
ncbi:MAG: RusA family crossover junction endodeoxyribonuclease, partial [Gammaproteobacteria bacterium]|nr:RusA family crossover junction endodeoxyribonuclease [Gammaproteobacteria bacterium]